MEGPTIQRGTLLTGRLGVYVVDVQAGRGGVGSVFKAKNTSTGQIVAIKVLHSDRFELTDVQRKRFQIEIETTLSIRSKYIVNGIDRGEYHQQPFLVMEWMGGGTLHQYMGTNDYGEPIALRIFAQLLKAFGALKAIPLVHRDIKPNNIFLDRNMNDAGSILKLGDLGIALSAEEAHLTLHGDQMGSLLYITERQRRDPSSSSLRDDFYSLSLVMYEVATRRRIHTRNPTLAYLGPSRVPRPFRFLIDWAMEDRERWNEVYEEMVNFIDLDSECANSAFPGSRMLPSPLISSRLPALNAALDQLIEARPAAQPPSSLLSRVVAEIVAAFRLAAVQLVDTEVCVNISDEMIDDMLGMDASFSGTLADRLDEANLLEGFIERSDAWIKLRERSSVVEICELSSRRIQIDSLYLDDLNFEGEENEDVGGTLAVFSSLDEAELESLRRIGQGLAIGLAIGAVERAIGLVD